MIDFPTVIMFDNIVLDDALEQLTPKVFKLFVWIYKTSQNTQNPKEAKRLGYNYWTDKELTEETHLDRYDLFESFLQLRQTERIVALLVKHDSFSKDPDELEYSWYMEIGNKGTQEVDQDHSIETPYHRDENDICLIIGKKQIMSLQTWEAIPRKQPKHKDRKHWRKIRAKTLERDGYQCTEFNNIDRLEAHHLTYENEGHEKLEDLITLCKSCHAKVPKKSHKGGKHE